MENRDYKLILESLLDIMDEGVYIVDNDGVGIFYNKAMSDVERCNRQRVSQGIPGGSSGREHDVSGAQKRNFDKE